jgi:hypothetical protein
VVLLDRTELLNVAELINTETGTAKAKGTSSKRDPLTGRDDSRSAKAFRLAATLLRETPSLTFDDLNKALHEHPETSEWAREKGDAKGGREIRNIWKKISTAIVLSHALRSTAHVSG